MIIEFDCAWCGEHRRVRRSKDRVTKTRFCSIDCRTKWQHVNRQSPAPKEWFYQKYIAEGLDCTQIGKLIDRDAKTVWYWLKLFEIPTRKRGHTGNHLRATRPAMLGKHHSIQTREKLRQARLKDGHVPYLKNGIHHLKGKSGADTPNWKGGITPERQDVYGSDEWKQAVKAVWKRDNATCQRCRLHRSEARKQNIDFDIHHIASFAVRELRCEPSNLILLCEPCHYWVHSSQNVDKEFLK